MKRLSIVIIAAILITLAGFYLMSLRTNPTEKGALQASETFYVSGKALVKGEDDVDWRQIEPDTPVADGDTITTSGKSTVEIKFGNKQKNIICVNNNTYVKLSRICRVGDKKIELEEGSIFFVLDEIDPDSTFEIITPTAVCGALGSGFEVIATEDLTVVKAFEGEIGVKNLKMFGIGPSKEVIVEEGNMTRVLKNKVPEEPRNYILEDLHKWQSWKDNIVYHLFRTFFVFTDESSERNRYHPSGWVGDYDAIRRVSSEKDPYSGENCVMFKYTARPTQGAGWAGVYWQHPVNNWGDVEGGFSLRGAKKLTFWARGENGGEKIVRFGAGGIGGEFPDSSKAEIGPIILEKEWRQYTIDLTGKDLSRISGGFFWMTDKTSNPEGAVFYIDEIKYE